MPNRNASKFKYMLKLTRRKVQTKLLEFALYLFINSP